MQKDYFFSTKMSISFIARIFPQFLTLRIFIGRFFKLEKKTNYTRALSVVRFKCSCGGRDRRRYFAQVANINRNSTLSTSELRTACSSATKGGNATRSTERITDVKSKIGTLCTSVGVNRFRDRLIKTLDEIDGIEERIISKEYNVSSFSPPLLIILCVHVVFHKYLKLEKYLLIII